MFSILRLLVTLAILFFFLFTIYYAYVPYVEATIMSEPQPSTSSTEIPASSSLPKVHPMEKNSIMWEIFKYIFWGFTVLTGVVFAFTIIGMLMDAFGVAPYRLNEDEIQNLHLDWREPLLDQNSDIDFICRY